MSNLPDDVVKRFWSFVPDRPDVGCWEWQGVRSTRGYGTMRAFGRTLRATHAAVLVTTGELPEAGKYVCHHCDNPPCVRPDHLFVGTPAENMRDCVRKGRNKFPEIPAEVKARGSKHGIAKLDEDKVRAIRASPKFINDIAAEYGVCRSTISKIRTRMYWKHV